MKDAVKGYLALASGLTEVTRQRAATAAKALVAQGEAAASQVTALTDDLLAQSKANREAVSALVRFEVDKALGRVGLASAEEVNELNARIRTLEAELRSARTGGDEPAKTGAAFKAPGGTAEAPAAKKAPAKKSPAKGPAKTTAKKAPAKKAPAKKTGRA